MKAAVYHQPYHISVEDPEITDAQDIILNEMQNRKLIYTKNTQGFN